MNHIYIPIIYEEVFLVLEAKANFLHLGRRWFLLCSLSFAQLTKVDNKKPETPISLVNFFIIGVFLKTNHQIKTFGFFLGCRLLCLGFLGKIRRFYLLKFFGLGLLPI